MLVFLPFRPITRGRLRRARWTGLAVGAAAFALYAATLARCAFPGESVRWIAWAAGLDVRDVPTHPLLCWLGQAAAGLPAFSLAVRLNLLAALAGALAVMGVYRIVWFFIFDTMREQSAVVRASGVAQFGGIVAAAAAGLSLPFWQAATRFRPEVFDAAILVGCVHLLTVYARTDRVRWLIAFGALAGAGCAESPLLIAAAPFLACLAVLVEWRLSWCQVRRLAAAAAVGLLALVAVHLLAAQSFVEAQPVGTGHRHVLHLVLTVLRVHLAGLKALRPSAHLWIPALAMGVGAAVVSCLAAYRALDNRRSWSLLAVNLALTASAVLLLANVPFSPWGVAALRGTLPVFTYLLAGAGIGLLAASWRAFYVLANPVDEGERTEEDDEAAGREAVPGVTACRFAGFLLAPAFAALVAIGGVVNGFRVVRDDGAFADRAADAVLDTLQGRAWIVGNGVLDAHLAVRASERGVRALVLSPHRAAERNYPAAVLRALRNDPALSAEARQRAATLIPYSFLVFIEDLFGSDAAIGGKAVSIGLPDLWYGSGWVPVPEKLCYGGVRALAGLQDRDLLGPHEAFWRAWEPFLRQGPGAPRDLTFAYRGAVRRHLAFVANNLGVALADLGRAEEAFRAYQQARAMDPDNISALLNVFELAARGTHPELKPGLEAELRRRVENRSRRYSLWALSRSSGYVRNSEMFVQMGWAWALSSTPGSVLAGLRSVYALEQDATRRAGLAGMIAALHEMRGDYKQSAAEYRQALARDPRDVAAISGLVRLALRENVVEEARRVLESGERAGASRRSLRQDWAALHLVSGDLPRARVLLQELADDPDARPMTLALLAMVMIEQNEIEAVEANVLPRLRKTAGDTADAYFALVVEGRVWQAKGRSGYKNARLCFRRAAALRPDVEVLQDVILSLDVALEDQPAAEAHALVLLRRRPDHPYANFILGSIRLEEGRYADAEPYLRRSATASSPTVAALNNYAQVLYRLRRFEEAERVGRQATQLAPDRYEGWSTLALVLAAAGRTDDAGAALARSRQINANDRRLALVDAIVALKRGDASAADRALAAAGPDETFSAIERRDFEALRDDIARLRRGR
jgi:tetratricopeptide (TPR) repeat protein